MRAWVVAAVAAGVLSACSGDVSDGDVKGTADPASDSPSSSPTSETPLLTLAEACAELDAASPNGFLPSTERWIKYRDEILDMTARADTEARNALGIVLEAVELHAAGPENGQPFIDAERAIIAAYDNMATRCRAVGSSAFQ